jgi:hypothetical protein
MKSKLGTADGGLDSAAGTRERLHDITSEKP